MSEEESAQLLEACSSCGTLIDVSDETPFSQIYCPSCGQSMRARRQFNNFTLLELLGEGGMGSVFKAMDVNLNRSVALKILRKECSANAEEREKLAQEARLTASINHPHVVKVFGFGEDRGQFYLAMELVEKGSLDDLMMLQKRVAEIQVLEVGMQIASGLQTANEIGLIHRDIKPANILFADANTAKLVDFGLALVMDEAASARGEIWGTPYYIAPEKLDNQPEDFRSDIYSLGGTLFHALAGRPPYEAETASMVALKQLKSRAVSLQTFAPGVSSETTYVINRMLQKDPAERYNDYQELIDHFAYCKQQLEERAAKPRAEKQRVVMESTGQRMLAGIISLIIILLLLGAGVVGFLNRDRIMEAFGITGAPVVAAYGAAELQSLIEDGAALLAEGRFAEAESLFASISGDDRVQRPLRDWAAMNLGLALMLDDQIEAGRGVFQNVREGGLFSFDREDSKLANFFVEAARLMASPNPIPSGRIRLYSKDNQDVFGILLFGLKNWSLGEPMSGGVMLEEFIRAQPEEPYAWLQVYHPLARRYIADYRIYRPLAEAAERAEESPEEAAKLLERVREAKGRIQTGPPLEEKLDELEIQLEAAAGG